MKNTNELQVGDQIEIWDRLNDAEAFEWVPVTVIGFGRRDKSEGFRASASKTSNGLPVEYDFPHDALLPVGSEADGKVGAIREV